MRETFRKTDDAAADDLSAAYRRWRNRRLARAASPGLHHRFSGPSASPLRPPFLDAVVEEIGDEYRAALGHGHGNGMTELAGTVSRLAEAGEECLACTYRHVPEENARERSIAEGLGGDLADVRVGLISEDVALRIVRTHPSIDPRAITGIAFDSLFRQLCA